MEPLSRCWRDGFSGAMGRSVRTIHASHVAALAVRHRFSQPFAASLLANFASHPPARTGGVTRSPRLGGITHTPSGLGTGPKSESTGVVAAASISGELYTSAVLFHSVITLASSSGRPSSAAAWATRTNSATNSA